LNKEVMEVVIRVVGDYRGFSWISWREFMGDLDALSYTLKL